MTKSKPRDHSLFLKAFRAYLQFVNSGLYFKKEHILGLENVPVNGTPTVIVSNHQNCLNDPLCVCLQLTDRRMNFLARANVFNNPVFNKALRAMGLLPAYRMGYDAEIPVVTRECCRNSRKTTGFPPLGKMRPLPATASQGKSPVPP